MPAGFGIRTVLLYPGVKAVGGDIETCCNAGNRIWALLRRQSETDDMAVINAKRVYRIMRQNALLLERKPAIPPLNGCIQGEWPLEKVTSGGALTASGSAVIMVKNCGSRSRWTAAIVKLCTGRQVMVDMTAKPYRT